MSQVQYSTPNDTDIAVPIPVFVMRAFDRLGSTLVTAGQPDGYVRIGEAVTVPCLAIGTNRSARQCTKTPSSLDV